MIYPTALEHTTLKYKLLPKYILTLKVGMDEETSTYSWSRFCTVNCRLTESNTHMSSGWDSNYDLRGGRRVCYHGATVAPQPKFNVYSINYRVHV